MQREQIIGTFDGNQAAAHVAYAYSEAAPVFPITPSSPMAELCGQWAGEGRKNIYGSAMEVIPLQSEAGAAGTLHGALLSGALATTFTASQGLLLMLPNLYRLAGEHLPGVIHVASRALATHALSIFGDHSDIYACRQTGAAIFACASVQEVMDLSPVSHLAALSGSLPFLNFFDGFRTSHEVQKIRVWDYEDLKAMQDTDALAAFRGRCLHPRHGRNFGSAQNPDIFFQAREASNPLYEALPGIVEEQLHKINARLDSKYGLFDYYGSPAATHVIIAMGSICETVREYLDYTGKEEYGLISVHLYRPFSPRHLLAVLPPRTARITVLDRTKEPGSVGEPLYLDVVSALEQSGRLAPGCGSADAGQPALRISSGRCGLGSKDVTPAQIAAVFHNTEKKFFTVGITDDVTGLSLPVPALPDTSPEGTTACKFWGLGGDGTVSATKNAIKIIGANTSLYAQGYFEYDSKKSRGLTISHLRFGKSPIHSAYRVYQADFAACHNSVYLHKYDMAQEIRENGSFLLNISCGTEEPGDCLPAALKRCLASRHIHLYVIDALGIGKEIGLNNKISTILQAAFFAVTKLLPPEEAMEKMMDAAAKSYGKEGEKILELNREAIRRGFSEVRELPVPESWKYAADEGDSACPEASCGATASERSRGRAASETGHTANVQNADARTAPNDSLTADARGADTRAAQKAALADYVREIQQPVADQKGDQLPVSAFLPYADGSTPPGSSAHDRRNVATEIPVWIPENCIQCTRCSFVCPHAVIRPAALDEDQAAGAPEGMPRLPMTGLVNHAFSVVISQVDCTGCGSCAAICPGRQGKKALEMHPAGGIGAAPGTGIPLRGQWAADREASESPRAFAQRCFDYAKPLLPCQEAVEKFGARTLKGSQFRQPFLEFSGACAGCGETPYVKLLTQLFGPELYIANATGCSSIWANSSPSCAYTLDREGCGPAWSNSLFEDAAEFGLGMLLAKEVSRRREHREGACGGCGEEACGKAHENCGKETCGKLRENCGEETCGKAHENCGKEICGKLRENCGEEACSVHHTSGPWIIGGDGWAYDIGFGGLDHILASGRNINLLVLDTEVYSNTGGQVSKATPLGSTAGFVSGGKTTAKKDLASIALTYGNVYVAQIALGADFDQAIQALTEAVDYDGPSLIIAYATCIAHGVKAGLGSSCHEMKKAVEAGYFHLFRFHPGLAEQGRNPFCLDSGKPALNYLEFLRGETRYGSLSRFHPDEAKELFTQAAMLAGQRYDYLKRLEAFYAV